VEHRLRNARAQADFVKRLVAAGKDPGNFDVPSMTKAGKTRRRSQPAAAPNPPPLPLHPLDGFLDPCPKANRFVEDQMLT
jgi:hypothetical protein